MPEVKRYRIGRVPVSKVGHKAVALIEDPNGEAVKFSDIAALQQRITELEQENERLKAPVSEEWVRSQQLDWASEGIWNATRWLNSLIASRATQNLPASREEAVIGYVGAPFHPWWDEAKTGPAPTCDVRGALMVRAGRFVNPSQKCEGWECLSCGQGKPDTPQLRLTWSANPCYTTTAPGN